MTAESPLSFEAEFLDSSRVRLYTAGTLRSIFAPLEGVGDGLVVDIGSGTGFFLAAFQKHCFEPALAAIGTHGSACVLQWERFAAAVSVCGLRTGPLCTQPAASSACQGHPR